ncbi:MAG: sigma-70 family RNA polymerase sigma factor [Clostridia bacterium]|nr:sigma-70 family RNA polymerase sigma factor [Clostridia bacterium]
MQEIKAPDPRAAEARFTEIVDSFQTYLLRMCYLELHDPGLAEDAVQETFVKAYRAMAAFRQESSVKTWLMRIAINTCRDMRRGPWWKRIDRTVTLDQLAERSVSFPMEAVTVNYEIAKLPAKLREVVLLYYYQDMKMEDIALALNISVSSVSGRLKRAKGKLCGALKEEYFDE